MRTTHARKRMAERTISESLLLDIIDTGTLKPKDAQRIWIFKGYPDRGDNLLCIAALLHTALIVKTVMQHFQPE
jgi:hypothetical protein